MHAYLYRLKAIEAIIHKGPLGTTEFLQLYHDIYKILDLCDTGRGRYKKKLCIITEYENRENSSPRERRTRW